VGAQVTETRAPARGWPVLTTRAATAVSAGYAAAGAFWALGGAGFPFGAGDSQAAENGELLRGVTPGPGGTVCAALGAAGVVVSRAMARRTLRLRPLLLGYGATLAVLLTLVLPEARAVKYLPPLGLLAFLRPPGWGTVNLVVLCLAGFAWAGATLAYRRATADACAACGRRDGTAAVTWLDRHREAVTWTAVAAPWAYALTRILWALDVPVGVPQAFLDHLNAANPGNRTRILELMLAGFAAGGSLLTAGLTRPWSEVFPRWVPGLAGRPVPRALPVGSAALVAFELTAFGVSLLPGTVAFLSGDRVVAGYRMGLLYPLPAIAILVWGVTLGLATVAFARAHRARCAACGAGPTPSRPR
jgi:hypothetical protein